MKTRSVDFVGSLADAKKFVTDNGGRFPRGLTLGRGGDEHSPNGDQMLFARYNTPEEREAVDAAFEQLGWERV